jgi:hypothetical protein
MVKIVRIHRTVFVAGVVEDKGKEEEEWPPESTRGYSML